MPEYLRSPVGRRSIEIAARAICTVRCAAARGAWLGLVPKQISTGDRTILGKISRRGNRYLRESEFHQK